MLIIGLQNDEDAGACLMRDGVILEAVNEERFNRIKLYHGLPERALQYVLDRHGLRLADIDCFAYGWYGKQNDYGDYAARLVRRVTWAVAEDPSCTEIIAQRIETEFARDEATRAQFQAWMENIGVAGEKISYLDHHACHAWSAFACSPFDKALAVTFDGRGDLKSASISLAEVETGVTEKDYNLSFDSLGFLYGQITHYLGFRPHRHEGKVTGLAAHGDPAKTLPLFERLIRWEQGEIRASLGVYRPFYTNQSAELTEALGEFEAKDIAAGVQAHCENLVVEYVKHWMARLDRPDIRDICLAGGLFANVRINQRVAEIDGVDNIFVFPHMGDGGLPVGAACHLNFRLAGVAKVALDVPYLGPSFTDDEIETAIADHASALDVEPINDVTQCTVHELMAGRVVGFFQNRMEFGPRALGARSILYHARDRSANDWLNKRLARTEFMPFAPVTTVEQAPECYIDWDAGDACSRMMTRTFACTPAFAERHPAVVHVDGTARPQIVDAARNGVYYDVVNGYCQAAGDKALINTSFNQHEEPIVCSPEDAFASLLNNNVDVLVIGNYRAVRRNGGP